MGYAQSTKWWKNSTTNFLVKYIKLQQCLKKAQQRKFCLRFAYGFCISPLIDVAEIAMHDN